jgi:hypothetical protein
LGALRLNLESLLGAISKTVDRCGYEGKAGVLSFPVLGPWVFTIASIWQLVAMVIAIRQALDFTSTWRAVGVAMVGFIPYVLLISIIYSLM